MKRLTIYCLYDSEGIIDKYVMHMLKELKTISEDIIIVSNSKICENDISVLENECKKIILRNNYGYDGGAFKDIILHHITDTQLEEYDELILLNDTFYGPFIPLTKMFQDMEKRECDFWGILKHLANSFISEHIQSYFLVIRKNMLHSQDFIEFWKQLIPGTSYDSAIENYELGFTSFFSRRGYSYDSYVDSDRYKECVESNNRNPLVGYMLEFVRDFNCPIVKRKQLIHNYNTIDEVWAVITYIRDNTDYDINLIWENILRKYNYRTINDAMKPVFVVGQQAQYNDELANQLIIVVYLHKDTYLDSIVSRLKKCLLHCKTIIITNNEIKNNIQFDESECQFLIIEKQHTPLKFFRKEMEKYVSDYNYILYINNENSLLQDPIHIEENSDCSRVWDNIALSDEYIANILDIFEKDKQLGIIFPPMEYIYNSKVKNEISWREAYKDIVKISSIDDNDRRFDKNIAPPIHGNSFVARVEAINKIWSMKWEFCESIDQECITRYLLPVSCQLSGYYYGQAVSYRTASVLMSCKLNTKIENIADCNDENVFAFTKRYRNNYIYGTGKIAERIYPKLLINNIKIDGFVVTDGKKKEDSFFSLPIIELSEYIKIKDAGVILALGNNNRKEVISSLNSLNYYDYISVVN